MLFYVGWKVGVGLGREALEASWALFERWEVPDGVELKGMWQRADGGGFGVWEAQSSEAIYEATAPWAEAYLDVDVAPIVEINKAFEISNEAKAIRDR
jgi:hypothetical protein